MESIRHNQFQLKADTFYSPPSVTAAAEISLNLQLQQPEFKMLMERFHDADARKRFPKTQADMEHTRLRWYS